MQQLRERLRQAIGEGLVWERVKGTPAAVKLALSWLGYGDTNFSEEEPDGTHWWEYMADPGGVPPYADLVVPYPHHG